ncbi:MAG: hypothetical protein HND43_00865 [Armatimonadetes bacterium]|nr:hypothetical protein [Armatimonadota bacterium]NOG37934.1 hypothetical protein [Armatimonadota bacterium]GIK31821.1 MAG: hypothetical protein BroJett009_08130 [Armatimonadota bacterium]
MPLKVRLAFDFVCEWSWIALHQAQRLARTREIEVEWESYELFPDDLPPNEGPHKANKPMRFHLALELAGLERFDDWTPRCHSHNAHEAVAFAKRQGDAPQLIERIFRAYWDDRKDISRVAALAELASGCVSDVGDMVRAIQERRYAEEIVPFDAPAHQRGVFGTPTWFIEGEAYLEETEAVLSRAIDRALKNQGPELAAPYRSLVFASGARGKPVVAINMVATIDGKTVSETRADPVMDLGSKFDQAALRNLHVAADAVIVGAQTLRSTPKAWFEPHLVRVAVTRSGELDFSTRFFTDAPAKAVVATPTSSRSPRPPEPIHTFEAGSEDVDLPALLAYLAKEHGVRSVIVEGGSDLNSSFLRLDLADELFLTVAPKVKLGRDLPTYAGGSPLSRADILRFELVSAIPLNDEVFLRYRRRR